MLKREKDEVETELDAQILSAFELADQSDTRDEVQQALDAQLLQLFELMDNLTAYDDQYDKMANVTAKLMQLRQNGVEQHAKAIVSASKLVELRKKDTISLEAWLTVGTHLAGVFMILNHERAHVIATKTFGLLKKII